MKENARRKLEFHRADHETVTGRPFEHFSCPILFVDEDVRLQRGHVINEDFRDAPDTWTIQRTDVDSFYGGMFEREHLLSARLKGKRCLDLLFDNYLYRECHPKLIHDGQQLKYFPRREEEWSDPPPPGHHKCDITHYDETIQICIKGLTESPDVQHMHFVVLKDLRLAAFVSLLKAAHLSMFSLFGYRYVYSDAGIMLGRDMLGAFYTANKNVHNKDKVQENALKFFRPYRFMVAPLTQGSTNLGGSITDRVFELCAGMTMLAWGLIVYVKTGDVRTAVILPMPDDPDAVETFRGFLANDNEQINLMIGQYQLDPGRWEVNPNRRMVTWNKDYDAWPLRLK
jgi:hypothetical protein